MIKHISHILGFIVVILAIFFIISGLPTTVETNTTSEVAISSTTVAEQQQAILAARKREHFQDLNLEAQAAHVFDARDGQDLFVQQIDTVMPLASLTKLMTALVALEYAPSETTRITIDFDAINQSGDTGLFFQEQWELMTLLDVVLVGSSNDAAQAVASSIAPFITLETQAPSSEDTFVSAMNDRAKRLGLDQTTFLTPTGLDINSETQASAHGSARDMTHLLAHILKHHPELLTATQESSITRSSLTHGAHYIENTNDLASDIPLLIGGKTGYTDHAGGNLTLAFDVGPAHPVIVTVLGSSREGRFTDMLQLVAATKSYFGYDD